LETDGFEINIPSRGTFKVKAVLSQFTGDNLAINQIFGLTKSFATIIFVRCAIVLEKKARIISKKKISTVEPQNLIN
jgi:hypothetical protein